MHLWSGQAVELGLKKAGILENLLINGCWLWSKKGMVNGLSRNGVGGFVCSKTGGGGVIVTFGLVQRHL